MEQRPWHAHWPDGVPRSIEYPVAPIQSLLDETARRFPERAATRFYGATESYSQLRDASDRLAGSLAHLGVSKGDRVSILMPNSPVFVIAFFAVLKAGGIVVQTNPLYTPRELTHLYRDSGTKVVICVDLFLKNVLKVREDVELEHVVVADIADDLPRFLALLYPLKKRKEFGKIEVPRAPWIHRFKPLSRSESSPPRISVSPREDIAVLQYTGGTTGIPKGAMLTHFNLVANAIQTARWLPDIKEGAEVFLSVIPFFHVYGLTTALLAPVFVGATMVIHANPREIGHILKLINKTKPTVFPGVPTMYVAMINNSKISKYSLRSIRACISGSAPLPLEVRRKFEALTGGKLVEGYGLTEASPVTHCNPVYGLVKDCIGIPFPDTDSKIVDMEKGVRDLNVGEIGELAVKGPQIMRGYWNKPEETEIVLRGGWLITGDIAKMDEDGYFHIVDRKKDLIICSGYNVYPREVEEVLFEYPSVKEAAVIGIPDPYRGESVKAFVVLKEGMRAGQEDIISFCRERLAPFKVPRTVEFCQELPKTMVGKVLRRALREKEQPAQSV